MYFFLVFRVFLRYIRHIAFTLPAVWDSKITELPSSQCVDCSSKRTSPSNKSREILMADDNPADVEMLRQAFVEAGLPARLYRVATGPDVIPDLKRRDEKSLPALVVLDLNLPQENGLTVLRGLQKHPLLRRIPTVLLSGLLSGNDKVAAQSEGALCLEKPFTFEDWIALAHQLDAFLQNAPSALLSAA
jgi:CheY-like chemotaxis protein